MADLKVLMFGYNGANNTGAEALLLASIENMRTVLGHDAVITGRNAWVQPHAGAPRVWRRGARRLQPVSAAPILAPPASA